MQKKSGYNDGRGNVLIGEDGSHEVVWSKNMAAPPPDDLTPEELVRRNSPPVLEPVDSYSISQWGDVLFQLKSLGLVDQNGAKKLRIVGLLGIQPTDGELPSSLLGELPNLKNNSSEDKPVFAFRLDATFPLPDTYGLDARKLLAVESLLSFAKQPGKAEPVLKDLPIAEFFPRAGGGTFDVGAFITETMGLEGFRFIIGFLVVPF